MFYYVKCLDTFLKKGKFTQLAVIKSTFCLDKNDVNMFKDMMSKSASDNNLSKYV